MLSKITTLIFLLVFLSEAKAQLVINEGSNRNYTSIADEDGEYPDWIELYNAGSAPVSLYNYSLTDHASEPQKWQFPNIQIQPGDYKIVFCSGKDRKPISTFVNVVNTTNFVPTTGWSNHTFTTPFDWDGVSNILINTCSFSNTGYTINSIFNQTATSFASSGFVFQDGSDASCSINTASVVNQRPNIRLNGSVIGTGTIQNSATDYPAPYGNWYWGSHHQMLILASELTAAGLVAGPINSLAFDVASTDPTNYTYFSIDMKLVAYNSLSTDLEALNPYMYQHTNFSISASGETVQLYDNNQTLLSQLSIQDQNPDESTGRFPDAAANSVNFEVSTPTLTNGQPGYSAHLMEPSFSVSPGIYGTTQNVTISNPNGGSSVIHYTMDGSEPSTSSPVYSGSPLSIFYSTVIRAKAFESGYLPSTIATASYLLGIHHETPVLSIVTPNDNLYGSSGIFDNWQFDWEKACHVDYFTEDTMYLLFSQNSGIQIDGGWGGSRSQPQHSFRLELNNGVLGDGAVHEKLIPNRPNRSKYSDLYFRNGSNQYLGFPYKDACQEEMMSATTNNYYSAWRPVSVYINGSYFGLYEMREKIDNEFFKQNEGADSDSTDILSLSAWQNFILRSISGNPVDTFYTRYNQFNSLSTSAPNYWNQADQYFDLKFYTDYIAAESWMGNTDWPGNNIKIYRSNTTGFRYRFCTIDMELSLAPNSWSDCYTDHISYMLGQSTGNPFINIWLKSIQNNVYHDYFINRFADLMNTEYLTDRLLSVEQSFFDQTAVEMQNEYQRWGDPNNIPQQMNAFNSNHLTFQDQLSLRSEQVRNHIEYNFNLPNQVDLTLDVYPPGAGKIHISTIEPDEYPWDGVYFNGVPVKIEAIANTDFHFSYWSSNGLIADTTQAVFLDTLDGSDFLFQANFIASGLGQQELTADSGYRLYPNPAKTDVKLINLSKSVNAGFEVLDMTGRKVFSGKINGKETVINLNGFPSGLYLINVTDNQGSAQLKFVKTE